MENISTKNFIYEIALKSYPERPFITTAPTAVKAHYRTYRDLDKCYDSFSDSIVGANSNNNLDVLFDGDSVPSNCHPHHNTKYFDSNGEIIRIYATSLLPRKRRY